MNGDVSTEVDALTGRMADLSRAAAELESAFASAGIANEDVSIIVGQAKKASATREETTRALAANDIGQVHVLLHRLNNDLTGALSIAALCRDDVTHAACVKALDSVDGAARAAADAVRQLNAALKR